VAVALQACFYIPWALLQSDDFTAAVAARKAYVDYIDHVHALAAIALKAADGVPGAGEGDWASVQRPGLLAGGCRLVLAGLAMLCWGVCCRNRR